jgi:hypothetical protein
VSCICCCLQGYFKAFGHLQVKLMPQAAYQGQNCVTMALVQLLKGLQKELLAETVGQTTEHIFVCMICHARCMRGVDFG